MSNRLKYVKVSDSIVADVLRNGVRGAFEPAGDRLPDDAQLVAVYFDGRSIGLNYHSAEFEEVRENAMIPEFKAAFRVIDPPEIGIS